MKEHKTPIRRILEFKNNLLLSCSWDGKILFWDLIQKKYIKELDSKTYLYIIIIMLTVIIILGIIIV